MNPTLTHPDPDLLARYYLGRVPPHELEAIERHVLSCEACYQQMESAPEDSFIGSLRSCEAGSKVRGERSAGAGQETVALRDDTADYDLSLIHPAAPQIAPSQPDAEEAARSIPAELVNHPRYRVKELCGCGGMGAVYRAEHRLMDREVALKVINPKMVERPEAVDRFRREVKAAARLSHPNIVHAYDAEQIGRLHLLVMEFVPGHHLADEVQRRGPLPIHEACRYVRQVAQGLQHAFERGMVHRDVKPQNLMLVVQGSGAGTQETRATPLVKILDFGLANFATEEMIAAPAAETMENALESTALTHASITLGTPDYIAPEQTLDPHAADIRADIYALGCTFYFLLSGRPPFPEGAVVDKIRCHLEREPRPVDELRDDVPPELLAVLRRMMAKDPGDRYQTPAEVAEALERWIDERIDEKLRDRGWDEAPPRLPAKPLAVDPRNPHRRAVLGATGLCLLISLILLGVVVYIKTDNGVVMIEADDPNVEVIVERGGREAAILDKKSNQRVTLDTGNYTVRLGSGAGSFEIVMPQDREITLRRFQREVVRVRRIEKELQPSPPEDGDWRSLFDGHTLAGWRAPEPNGSKNPWWVDDGWVTGNPLSHLVSNEEFDDFELTFQWKTSPGGNGGVLYRVPSVSVWNESITSFPQVAAEYQVLDNAGNPDGDRPEKSCGAVFGILAPRRDLTRPAGEVNESRIVCRGAHVEHWLNGERMVAYDLSSDDWEQSVQNRRAEISDPAYRPAPGFAQTRRGHIALQAWQGRVFYRNIRIRPLR